MRLMRSTLLACVLLAISVPRALAWNPGERVLGLWKDTFWYPATVSSKAGNSYKLTFDDGDTLTVKANQIKKITWKTGSVLQCRWNNGEVYYRGKITAMEGESIQFHFDDGDQVTATISICRGK